MSKYPIIYELKAIKICERVLDAYENKEKIFSLPDIKEKMLPEKQLISVLPKTNKVKQARWLFFACPGDKMIDSSKYYKRFSEFYLSHKSFFDPRNLRRDNFEDDLDNKLLRKIRVATPGEFLRFSVSNAKKLMKDFGGNPINILRDSDYKESVDKLTQFLGYGEQISRLFLIFLNQYDIKKTEKLAPKVDRHFLRISIGCGVASIRKDRTIRADKVVRELSKTYKKICDIKKYDAIKLDPTIWIIGHELCSRNNETICKMYCPLDIYCDKNIPKLNRENARLYKKSKKLTSLVLPFNSGKNIWDSDLPLSRLPENIEKKFREYANFLHIDLKRNKQIVTLSEAPYPYTKENKIRVAVNFPPQWFSKLYYVLNKSRKNTFQTLSRIINSKDKEYKNYLNRLDSVLRELIFQHLIEGYIIEENNKEYLLAVPDNEIRGFFGLKPLDLKEFEKQFENLEEKAYQSEIPF